MFPPTKAGIQATNFCLRASDRATCPLVLFSMILRRLLLAASHLRLGSSLRTGHLWRADKFIKKRPVLNHGLAQFLGAGLPARLTNGNCMGRAVVPEDQRIGHGDIRGTL